MSSLGSFGSGSSGLEDRIDSRLQPSPGPVVPVQAATPDTVGSLASLDPAASGIEAAPSDLWSAEQSGSTPYNEYLIDTSYETDSGIRQMPLASNGGGPSCAFVQIHAEVTRKKVQWTAERIGAAPTCPHWDTGNANEVLLSRKIKPCSTFVMPDSMTQVWRVEGVYVYGLKVATGEGDRLFAGAIPVCTLAASTQSISGTNFSKEILRAT